MTVALDAVSSGVLSGTSLTVAHTCTGSNLALVVSVVCNNSTDTVGSGTSVVTYNGVSMGAAVAEHITYNGNRVRQYVLVNPATGTHNIVVTPASSAVGGMVAVSFTGVDQTAPTDSTTSYQGSGVGTHSQAVTVSAGGMAVDAICIGAGGSAALAPSVATHVALLNTYSTYYFDASYLLNATAMAWTWTGTLYNTHTSVSLKAAGAADTTPPTLTGAITVGTVTSSSVQLSWPTGADDTAVTSYETSSDAGATWTDRGLVTTYTYTGLAASTSYTFQVRAKDAAANVSTPALSVTQSTSAAAASTHIGATVSRPQQMGRSAFGIRR